MIVVSQGWFPTFGLALWEAAHYIAQRFPHTETGAKGGQLLHEEWFHTVLTNKYNHFSEAVFTKDGMKYLSKDGFAKILAEDFLFAEEIQLYRCLPKSYFCDSVMSFVRCLDRLQYRATFGTVPNSPPESSQRILGWLRTSILGACAYSCDVQVRDAVGEGEVAKACGSRAGMGGQDLH